MAKQKIADLPQEEQDKIINEMKELGIGGVYATYTVEKAQAAIEKKKAEKDNKPETDGDGANVTPDNPDDKNEGEQIVAGDGGVFDENGEKPDGETSNPENPENSEDKQDEDKKEDKPENKEPAKKEDKPENKEPEKPAKKSDGICHICRSRVYDGVCSGCGFTLRR